jgi:hypothetical protein
MGLYSDHYATFLQKCYAISKMGRMRLSEEVIYAIFDIDLRKIRII